MDEQLILRMIEPYQKDGNLTYIDFDNLFDVLSRQEQYQIVTLLISHGIELIDSPADEILELDEPIEELKDEIFSEDTDEPVNQESGELLYDIGLFTDERADETVYIKAAKEIKQSNELLCIQFQEGSRQAIQDLCVKNWGLVATQAKRYTGAWNNDLDCQDLEQLGFLGLIEAAEKFDHTKGNQFSTYAMFWIQQAIMRGIFDTGYAIRIPVHMMERINKVARVDLSLAGQYPDIGERIAKIAEETELSAESVTDCLVLRQNYVRTRSLNVPVGEDMDTELMLLLEDDGPSTEEQVIAAGLREDLLKVMATLPEREEYVLKHRFGFADGDQGKTLDEIGKMLHVTRERIRQIEAKALRKLWHPTRKQYFEDYYK